MKNFEMKNFEVVELSFNEQIDTDGGFIVLLIALAPIAFGVYYYYTYM